MRRWATMIIGIGLFAAERGLDVSGIEYLPLAIGLWSLAVILVVTGGYLLGWPILKRVRIGLAPTDGSSASTTKTNDEVANVVPPLYPVLIEGRRHDGLEIHKVPTPWQIWYPMHFFNGGNVPVDIVGYNLNLLLDDSPMTRITWHSPDGEASNGIRLVPDMVSWESYTIQPGQTYKLTVPVNRRDIKDLPRNNPKWGARGRVYLRYNGEELPQPYDFSTDSYELDRWDWTEWAGQ